MKHILSYVDGVLNRYTMYVVVLYGLVGMVAWAIMASIFGWLPQPAIGLLSSLGLVVSIGYLSNRVFELFLKIPANKESFLITSLILFFLMPPVLLVEDAVVVSAAVFAAMASKFVFVYRNNHVFNPVAAGAVLVSVLGIGGATWWVATPSMVLITLLVGFAIVRKTRKETMVGLFLIAAILSISFANLSFLQSASDVQEFALELLVSWPLLFFGAVMLTEPFTLPSRKKHQIIYALGVGLLMGIPYSFGTIYSTPEMSLLIGNLYAFLVNPKIKNWLILQSKKEVGPNLWRFEFQPPKLHAFSNKSGFQAGEYAEWMLPHANSDLRGTRRFLTIASSPIENSLSIVVKIPDTRSSFKQKLVDLKVGQKIGFANISGEFVLPRDQEQKLAWIAGGIGVTPFLSMAKYLIDTKQTRDVRLLYVCSNGSEFVHKEIFEQAERLGVKTTYVITRSNDLPKNWKGEVGRLTPDMISRLVSDFSERLWYLSGPNAMVEEYDSQLKELKIVSAKRKKDFFPGF